MHFKMSMPIILTRIEQAYCFLIFRIGKRCYITTFILIAVRASIGEIFKNSQAAMLYASDMVYMKYGGQNLILCRK